MNVGAGICLYLLFELLDADWLPERTILTIMIYAGVFFGSLLSLVGPMKVIPSALRAAGLAAAVAGLMLLTSFRFANVDGLFDGPFHLLAAFAVSAITLPFLIGLSGAGWRDYPTLFDGAWGIVVRSAAAGVFTGVVWGVIYLSDALLQVVGLGLIQELLRIDMVPWIITGATYGLALAVVHELRAYVSPHLILRLLRLLVPVVLVVMAVFIVALPFQGLSKVFQSLSAGGTMLAMVGAGVTLVSVTIDKDAADATGSAMLAHAARALAAILVIPAALACYAVWLRVDDYGWTPERLFAALAAGIALIYGVVYLAAAVRGAVWMARVRQANIGMAGLVAAVSALWLTPVLNAERISAQSQAARFAAGEMEVAEISVWIFEKWGIAGEAFVAELRAKAAEPGQEALAAQLDGGGYGAESPADRAAIVAALRDNMPLQPPTATALRDRVLAEAEIYDLIPLRDACGTVMANGRKGCVMVVADLQTETPGDEVMIVQYLSPDYGTYAAFVPTADGLSLRTVIGVDTSVDFYSSIEATITAWQDAAPVTRPAPYNLIVMPDGNGVMMSPW